MTTVGAASALAMAGLVWFVQVVHYPLFALVGAEQWERYHAEHSRRTTWVVAPLMITELVTALLLVDEGALGVIGAALAGSTWLLTFGLAVPRHQRLDGVFDPAVGASLVRVNWLRTIAWTAHAAVALALAT